jgi:hypothetical protein
MKHDTHTHHIMKDTDSFYVRICNCGVVHLCFGPTTLNLTPDAVIAVTETLKQVSHELLIKKTTETHPNAPAVELNPGNVLQGNFGSRMNTLNS